MNTIERLKDMLEKSGKKRGFKKPMYLPDGTWHHDARHYIEVAAGDVVELAELTDKSHPTVADLHVGSESHKPDLRVTIRADDLYTLIEEAEKATAPPPAASPVVAEVATPVVAGTASPVVAESAAPAEAPK